MKYTKVVKQEINIVMNVGQNTQTVSVDASSMCEYHDFFCLN